VQQQNAAASPVVAPKMQRENVQKSLVMFILQISQFFKSQLVNRVYPRIAYDALHHF
jgi:hypothetical protein